MGHAGQLRFARWVIWVTNDVGLISAARLVDICGTELATCVAYTVQLLPSVADDDSTKLLEYVCEQPPSVDVASGYQLNQSSGG